MRSNIASLLRVLKFRLQAARVQAVVVQPFFDPYRKALLELATQHGLGYLSGRRDTTVAGGLVSISGSF